jgi:2-keto-4-pentenoate hydratase/2-oxohepta-3-ene-1,7-dioic acid hydratase in catechol pathway
VIFLKFVRFQLDQEIHYGVLADKGVRLIEGDIFAGYSVTDRSLDLAEVRLLAPCTPSKAICIGLNYHDHAREMKSDLPTRPLLFMKPTSALTHPGGDIEYPAITSNLHYEAELAVVIGKTAKKVPAAQAYDYILGYTCANDVTARDVQRADGQWTRGKSCDTFLPLGPCIETQADTDNIAVNLYLNGELRQSSNTANLIFKVPELIAFITESMTLNPGDVILTGTPAGVGPMQVGDEVTVELGGIGRLVNRIVRG